MSVAPVPTITAGQVVLLRDDIYSGVVKDVNLDNAINESQEVWSIFESLETAIRVAKEIVSDNDKIECLIFDKDRKVIEHFKPFPF